VSRSPSWFLYSRPDIKVWQDSDVPTNERALGTLRILAEQAGVGLRVDVLPSMQLIIEHGSHTAPTITRR
jgi:hypothetical protein